MAGQQRSSAVPTCMRDADGKVQHGQTGVLKVLTQHFSNLLGGDAELSQETCNQMEAEIFMFEQANIDGGTNSTAGECPTVAEVEECIKALRNHAAPGEDMIDARMLKAGPTITSWLHRVITAVWRSGKAPAEWKSALIVPLYKNKGAKDVSGNYRGISLLSIAGKVYAAILMRRVYQQVDNKLHEAQCGFRQGRGTVDAMFALRSVGAACSEYKACLAKAYIDFTKAYDSINRQALWKALRLYGVHPKLISLLEDLHTGTLAAVRLDGSVGSRFLVTAGVRQGCVIAPTLFNVFIDLVVRKALARMPSECGIRIRSQFHSQPDLNHIEHIVMLMYADDLVLFAHDPGCLAEMLLVIDKVASEFGMTINASKTEIQIQHHGDVEVAPIGLTTGVVQRVSDFKYLGSWIQERCSMDKEVGVRRGRALGVFQSFDKVWSNKKLKVADKMAVYNSLVVPHFTYGCESWNCTTAQLQSLETAHSFCLRRIVGVDRLARHTLRHIRTVCHTEALELLIIRRTFQWLGHVMRMHDARYPKLTYNCVPESGVRGRGRPSGTFRHAHCEMLKKVGIAEPKDWLSDMQVYAQDRVTWRDKVKEFTLQPHVMNVGARRSTRSHANMT